MGDYLKVIFIIEPFDPWADVMAYQLGECGFESFEKSDPELMAYIKEEQYDEQQVYNIIYELSEAARIEFNTQRIEKQNWNEVWEKNYDSVQIGDKLLIRAPFHESSDQFEMEILLTPKMSFGTGHHATTQLMASRMFDVDFNEKEVMDVGCGTGILAILAEKLGAKDVFAFDIDQWAVENAIENVEINNCNKIIVEKLQVQDSTKKSYNVILANINLNVILNDLNIYVDQLAAGGSLLVSGFLKSDTDAVIEAATAQGLNLEFSGDSGEWAILHFIKNS